MLVAPFDELTDYAQEIALDRYRDINTEHEWWDYIVAELAYNCKRFGVIFDAKDVYFSICGRDNHIGINSRNLSFNWNSYVYLPHKFGAYQNYLGGGMVGSILCEQVEARRIDVEEDEDVDMIVENINTALEYFKDTLDRLWEAYDYLTSDVSVAETLKLNEYEFDEDGKIV